MRFGGVEALDNVSVEVRTGEILAIVGPNGAGKSTLFNLVSRFVDAHQGDVRFEGRSLLGCAPAEIAPLGIARTFQNTELFEQASVADNILAGRHVAGRSSVLAQLLYTRGVAREERAHREAVEQVIKGARPRRLPRAADRRARLRDPQEGRGRARALATGPKLILLDEPASGLSPEETQRAGAQIEAMRARTGMTVLMVEHHMGMVEAVADRVLVLAEGRTIALGAPGEVLQHPDVVEAYLGAPAP